MHAKLSVHQSLVHGPTMAQWLGILAYIGVARVQNPARPLLFPLANNRILDVFPSVSITNVVYWLNS